MMFAKRRAQRLGWLGAGLRPRGKAQARPSRVRVTSEGVNSPPSCHARACAVCGVWLAGSTKRLADIVRCACFAAARLLGRSFIVAILNTLPPPTPKQAKSWATTSRAGLCATDSAVATTTHAATTALHSTSHQPAP
jgi:hypothetical protein